MSLLISLEFEMHVCCLNCVKKWILHQCGTQQLTNAGYSQGASRSRRTDEKSDVDSILPRSGKGLKAILGGLEELWDQSQYTEEYNVSQFLAKLNG